ncbi:MULTISPECIES: DUF5678 domain-containing protein [Thermofilum]|uniref:DUF5678 domain-containing protein n=2 Tax=Thermofilum adornatum TaxID=1365176 RepID=S5Z9B5_9CREN|nr:DUF5678 domain-containing protein [Thermofilum adornatum]AGT35960.1 hypothetical protein N186_08110 [Thermofilum adornatum]
MSEILVLFDEYDKNWSWFMEHYEELAERFDGEFVAIYQQRVVDHEKDIGSLMKRIRKKYPLGQVLVEFVSKEKLAFII